MADINITCPKCSTVTTISEFADDTNLKCHSCGATLEKPGGLIQAATKDQTADSINPPKSKSKLRVARRKKEPIITEEEGQASLIDVADRPQNETREDGLKLRPKVKVKKSRFNHTILATLLFLILAGGTGYLRYGNVLPDNILELSVLYSWLIFLAFHAMITTKAMTDNIMQGILCLLVPGYSLFYLFAVSDNFYLRAILAGLLIGIGQDAAAELKVRAGAITKVANDFIAGGGGDINQKSTWH